MAICDRCHTRMSKRRLNIHKHGCTGEHTKGYDHFMVCRSFYRPKKDSIGR